MWERRTITAGILVILIALLYLMLLTKASAGEILIVTKDGSGDFLSVQDAIDNSSENDTIRVWEGTYVEHLQINQSVNIIGNGSDITNIDGNWSENIVSISTSHVNITGFSFFNASNYGIIMNNSNDVNISHNSIREIRSTAENDSIGIIVKLSENISIRGNHIRNIIASNSFSVNELPDSGLSGIGVYLNATNRCVITENNIERVYGGDCPKSGRPIRGGTGAGIWLQKSSNLRISNNSVNTIRGGNGSFSDGTHSSGNGGIGTAFHIEESTKNYRYYPP